ncbi:XRE family transcriptional regulator [Pyruvatibacter mobilis]|uniref:XRE family transcriptional regulator n=1 Tax=Pyruvatibacter mobilis TaxID=1712261 RepID=UPI003C7D4179
MCRKALGLTTEEAATRFGVSRRTLESYERNQGDPKASFLSSLVSAGADPSWLLAQETPEAIGNPDNQTPTIYIPRFDVTLSAGAGAFADRAQQLDAIPFTQDFLRRKLGRTSTEGLAALDVMGDSMAPTLSDGDLVIADQNMRAAGDGVYAISIGDVLAVKRLHRRTDGGVDVISDNPHYPTENKSEEEAAETMTIIGRVRWASRMI